MKETALDRRWKRRLAALPRLQLKQANDFWWMLGQSQSSTEPQGFYIQRPTEHLLREEP